MPIYKDSWESGDYQLRFNLNLKDLTANHVNKMKKLDFQFVEYTANERLPCLIYDRTTQRCMNQYGVMEEFVENAACQDAFKWYRDCIKAHAGYALLKKYFPQNLVSNEFSRPNPSPKDLGL